MTLQEYIDYFLIEPDAELFHELCEEGDIAIIKPLLEQKRDNGAPLLSRDTLSLALIKAVVVNELEVVKLLVLHGADIHSNQNMALNQAIYFNYQEIIQYLRGLECSSSSSSDYSPSFFKSHHQELIVSESSLFQDCCKIGDTNLVSELLESNQVLSDDIFKGLIHAIFNTNLDIVTLITLKGPKLDFDYQYQGETILGHATNVGCDAIRDHLLQIKMLQTGSMNETEQMNLFTQAHGLVEAEIDEQVDMDEEPLILDYAYFGF